MKTLFIIGLLVTASPQFGAVQYYATDKLTSLSSTTWAVSGKLNPSASGLSAPDPAGGSLISKIPIPDGTSEAEVIMSLTLITSGGTYTEFLGASPDARTASTAGAGSYLAFEMQSPTFDSAHNCVANFVVLQGAAGNVTALASFQHACRNGMFMRLAAQNGIALVWPDEATPIELYTALNSGQPGIGAYATPSGNSISEVQLGAIGRTGLPPLNQAAIKTSAFRNRINVHWSGVPVAATSSGLNAYLVYRDGSYLLRTSNVYFVDEAAAPGVTHTYTIYVVDQHFNISQGTSVDVTTPAATPKSGTPPPPTLPVKK